MDRYPLLKECIRQIIISEQNEGNLLKTKSGQTISFKVDEDVEPENRGFVVDQLTAFVDGKEAGYIRIENIPKENIPIFFPNGYLDYARHFSGSGYYLRDLDQKSEAEQIYNLYRFLGGFHKTESDFQSMSSDELKNEKEILTQKIKKKYEKEYQMFLDYKVGKPFVGYIFVHDGQLRNRVGLALYIGAAQWLAKRGLKLYASSLQSDQALSVWAFMKKHMPEHIGHETGVWYGKKKNRTYLSYL